MLEAEWSAANADGSTPEPRKIKINRAFASSWAKDQEPGKVLDDNADSGWRPERWAEPEAALFVFEQPVELPTNAEVRLRLQFAASVPKTGLDRIRISASYGQGDCRAAEPAETAVVASDRALQEPGGGGGIGPGV